MFLSWIIFVTLLSSTLCEASKLLVATGYNLNLADEGTGTLASTEIFDVSDSSNDCPDLGVYPMAVELAVGGLLDGQVPVICGGDDANHGNYTLNNFCYTLGPQKLSVELPEDFVQFASSIMINSSHLWITGGNAEGKTAFVYIEGDELKVEFGPRIPEPVSFHCMAQLSDTAFILIGGLLSGPSDYTVIYDFATEEWTVGPKLHSERYLQSCGTIYDPETDRTLVAVAHGSFPGSVPIAPMEYLDVNNIELGFGLEFPDLPNVWPNVISGHSLVQVTKSSMILVGGNYYDYSDPHGFYMNEDMFLLECTEDGCEWTVIDQKLADPRAYFVAMMITDQLTNC